MSSSPYVPQDVKAYLRKYEVHFPYPDRKAHQLHAQFPPPHSSVRPLRLPRRHLPASQTLPTQLASPSVTLLDLNAVELISGEGFPVLRISATVDYLNKQLKMSLPQPLSILSEENMLYDEDRLGGKGLHKSIAFIKSKLLPRIKGLSCEQQ